jgi:anaerobic dimethyl sulfoxide reductase subunit B
MVQYGFYFDQSRCIGCNACSVACKQWHGIAPGPQKWMRVYQWERGSFPDLKMHFLAIPCYHCEKPMCARSCPNGAIYKEDRHGAVLIDPQKCRGERKCWKGCPYGSILFGSDNPGEKASKCTMCIDRLNEGKSPICILSCSMRALEFGPIDELRVRFGGVQELEEMPPGRITGPSVVFKPSDQKKEILVWNSEKALGLWKSRGPNAPESAPDLFGAAEMVTDPPAGIVGRDRLVLKATSSRELLYYTSDDD